MPFRFTAPTAIPTSTRSAAFSETARARSFTRGRARSTRSCRLTTSSGTGRTAPRHDRAEAHPGFEVTRDLSLEFLRVVEQAAIACAHTMGQGDRHRSDHVAVEAMRSVMDSVPIDGTIVIGEGERDEAPMLYIGEKVGMAHAA